VRVTLIHNPTAGDQRSADELLAAFAAAGHDPAYHSAKKKKLRKALQDPGDLVVAAGGDGTVKKVATLLAGRQTPMAILPLGTANNVARSLGVRWSVEELVRALPSAVRRRIDVGVVRASWGDDYFLESFGGGLVTQLIARGKEEVDENPAVPTEDELHHALRLLKRILQSSSPERWCLTLDDRDLSGEYLLVEAMNIPLIGPNIPLAPHADPGDGLLDVVTISEHERERFAAYVARRLKGDVPPPELVVHRGRSLRIAPPGCDLHLDDDLWPDNSGEEREEEACEFQLSVECGAVEVLVERS
jgi:diacylglycerol kinase (ATP)